MTSLDPLFLGRLVVPPRLIRTLTALAEFRGKQALWMRTKPEVLRELRKIAVIESAESSSRMENVEVGPQTYDRILKRAEVPDPQSRSQTELAGYRDALNLIHQNAADMAPAEGVVQQLHATLMHYTPSGGGTYKGTPNDIVEKDAEGRITRVRFRTTSPALTPSAMATLHEGLAAALAADEIEPPLLVPLYVHDFLCIHPFTDGNGRVARLMTNLLLHRLGHDVGRYVSLERIIEETKATYYDSLAASDAGWPGGQHNHLPFTEYLLGVVLAAYRELEKNTAMDLNHGSRTRVVERAVAGLPAQFRFADVVKRSPLVNEGTVRTILNRMAKEGKIVAEGRGRSATWRRLQ